MDRSRLDVHQEADLIPPKTPKKRRSVRKNASPFSWNLFTNVIAAEEVPGIDPAVTGNADTDGDGFTAYQEWIAGTDPKKESSRLRLEIVKTENGREARWPEIPQRKYILQHSSDLVQWTNLTTSTPQTSGPGSFPLPEVQSGFYRILVSLAN